jgi:hypothetical protein
MNQLKKSISFAQICYLIVLSSNVSLFCSFLSFNQNTRDLTHSSKESDLKDPKDNLEKKLSTSAPGIAFATTHKKPTVNQAQTTRDTTQNRNKLLNIYKFVHHKEYTLSLWVENFDTQGKSEEKVDLVLTWYYYLFVVRITHKVNHETICERLQKGTYPGATRQETIAFKALQANHAESRVTYDQIKELVFSKRHLYS